MKRFKNILIVVGSGSNLQENPALRRGLELAKRNSARVTVMDVVKASASAQREYEGILGSDELAQMLADNRKKELHSFVSNESSDLDIEVKVAVGHDFIEIVRSVLQDNHDIVIKLANARVDSFDSSDFHLMRKCPCPVWLLKPNAPKYSRRVLAAVDLNMEVDIEGRALNRMIMDLGTSLAKAEGGHVDVISCWTLYGESALRHSGFMKVSEEKLNKILQEEKASQRSRLDQLAEDYQLDEYNSHLIKGDPIDEIPKFVKKNKVDVVVMGTLARSGIPGLLIGNTAETILQLINTSVITLKPSNFRSPVTV